jgi:ParB/RepB/Spo0J family partition protein
MAEEKIIPVPLKDITADYTWNMRTLNLAELAKDEDYQQLKASLQDKGQDEPLMIRPIKGKPNKYQLLSGFRRYTALGELTMTHAMCRVKELTDAEARSMNVRENCARADVNIADRCWGVGQLYASRVANGSPDVKITDESIGREVGLSTGFCNRLLRVYNGLGEPVFKAWRAMAAPLALSEILTIAELPKGGQMAAFKEKIASREAKDTKGGRGAWIKTVIKQAQALGEGLGALESHGVIRVDSKEVAKFDFSVLFEKIPENATDAQRKQIAGAMGEAYTRAKLGFEDTPTDEAEEADDAGL